MRYPGYLLNPGDMFQVEPERVLFATGAPKDKAERRAGRRVKRQATKTASETELQEEKTSEAAPEDTPKSQPEQELDSKQVLKSLLSQAKSILSAPKDTVAAKRKQDLRAFSRAVKRTLSRSSTSTTLTDDLEAQFLELTAKLKITTAKDDKDKDAKSKNPRGNRGKSQEKEKDSSESTTTTPQTTATEGPASTDLSTTTITPSELNELSTYEIRRLREALIAARENPIDPTKPYATPWRPRDYMSAFAFVPRYLEVNHNICSAVYIRHPVARPGSAEVPTPFAADTNQLAFNWCRRRR